MATNNVLIENPSDNLLVMYRSELVVSLVLLAAVVVETGIMVVTSEEMV